MLAGLLATVAATGCCSDCCKKLWGTGYPAGETQETYNRSRLNNAATGLADDKAAAGQQMTGSVERIQGKIY